MLTLPADDLEKQEVLVQVMQKFAEDIRYTEDEVNTLIK